MEQPLINILMRVSRPKLFERCIATVHSQTYNNIKFITYQDTEQRKRNPYDWNLFCNILKSKVESGYFFYLDDDDYLLDPFIIGHLATHLQDNPDGLIVQFLRNGKTKPSDHAIAIKSIRKGLIGGGCLVLHSRHKDVADWEAKEAADFTWIKAVSKKVELKFVPLVLQVAGNNGLHGAQPSIE